tara:strand:+ start:3137 stop:4057 length:921 start_codon:yes stop_codon:yes gene_type:complete
MVKVLVLGASGMAGSMVVQWLKLASRFDLSASVRDPEILKLCSEKNPDISWHLLDWPALTDDSWRGAFQGVDWVINAIGVIKPYIDDQDVEKVINAIQVNGILPHVAANLASECGAHLLNITTDCVFSGSRGSYSEEDPHDAVDVYGKSKSIGEVYVASASHIRCSIVGPESGGRQSSLLEWFLSQPPNAEIFGFTNHLWNGVTTLHFAKICQGIIDNDFQFGHLHHLTPKGRVTKSELLSVFGEEFGREDVSIVPTDAKVASNLTLASNSNAVNDELWRMAGYSDPPTVKDMVKELAEFSGKYWD